MALELYGVDICKEHLAHHGILGMKWGVRRYQNKDGTLTAAGKKHQIQQNTAQADPDSYDIPDTPKAHYSLKGQTESDFMHDLETRPVIKNQWGNLESSAQVKLGKDLVDIEIYHNSDSDWNDHQANYKKVAQCLSKIDSDTVKQTCAKMISDTNFYKESNSQSTINDIADNLEIGSLGFDPAHDIVWYTCWEKRNRYTYGHILSTETHMSDPNKFKNPYNWSWDG